MRPLRVAINAQLIGDGRSGGIEQNLIGLVSALGRLGGADEYLLIMYPGHSDWLRPYVAPNQRLVSLEAAGAAVGGAFIDATRGHITPLRAVARGLQAQSRRLLKIGDGAPLASSYGRIERLKVDVVHFPEQSYIDGVLPSIFVPHDLQHLHLPEFFSKDEFERRERTYRAACSRASAIVVEAEWVKLDLITQYGVAAQKVQVIPTAAPTAAYPEPLGPVDAALRSLKVEPPYLLYPAVTWPHKNHVRLFEALATIRKRHGLELHLVCTGKRFDEHWPHVEKALLQCGLRDQVLFLGFVSPTHLRALYRGCLGLVMPTLFESVSAPVFEAWYDGCPVACSAVTALPEQVGDAAVLFDPYDVSAMADAIYRLATDDALRERLRRRGRQRLARFSWERTAKAYRALYRRLAGRTLTTEERQLLTWNWMKGAFVDEPHI